jgi:hypothetical protein
LFGPESVAVELERKKWTGEPAGGQAVEQRKGL